MYLRNSFGNRRVTLQAHAQLVDVVTDLGAENVLLFELVTKIINLVPKTKFLNSMLECHKTTLATLKNTNLYPKIMKNINILQEILFFFNLPSIRNSFVKFFGGVETTKLVVQKPCN